MNHRIFERTLRPLVFRRACLFECHYILNFNNFLYYWSLDVEVFCAGISDVRLLSNVLVEPVQLGYPWCDNYLRFGLVSNKLLVVNVLWYVGWGIAIYLALPGSLG